AVLENLSTLVRERLNMAAKLKAHTAQQRFSAGLLCALPLVVGMGFWILKPEYMRLLWTDPTGKKFFTYAIISEIVGILVIRKIANIKVLGRADQSPLLPADRRNIVRAPVDRLAAFPIAG